MKPERLIRKRQRETAIITEMIGIYCRGQQHPADCPDCRELSDYARHRVEQCPHMETKSFCSVCPTQCYDAAHRAAIRQVMRFSGRRYFLRRPIRTLAHGWVTVKNRGIQKRLEKPSS